MEAAPPPSVATTKAPTDPVQREPCPEATANIFSKIFFGWVFPLIWRGWKNPLQDTNLWELQPFEQGAYTTKTLLDKWISVKKDTSKNLRLQHAVFTCTRGSLIFTGVLKAIDITLNVLQPVFMNRLLVVLAEKRSASEGILWCIPLLVVPLLKTIVESHYFMRVMRAGMRTRSSLQGVIFDKSLRMSPAARASCSLGEIVNLMQLDTQRIGDFLQFFHTLWAAPIQIVVTVVLLYLYIGPSALIGLLITLLTLPLQGVLMSAQVKLRRQSVGIADRRVKLMNEILQGIKAVKMYAWEDPFAKEVQKERSMEIKKLGSSAWLRSGFLAIMMAIPVVIGVITFSFYTGVFKRVLNPAEIFTGVALLNQLRVPVMMLPMTVNTFIDARLGLKRIERFLDLQDTDNYSRVKASPTKVPPTDSERDIALQDGIKEMDSSVFPEISENNLKEKYSSSNSSVLTGVPEIRIENGEFEWSQISQNPLDIGPRKKMFSSCFPKRKKAAADKKATDESKDKQNSSTSKQEDTAPESTGESVDLNKYISLRGSVLNDINLHVRSGELTAIVGHVGSGKSSLFHAILGEMRKVRGAVSLQGSVAYVAQTAWIFNDTLKNNILFGKSYDEELYKMAIEVSALKHDIAIFSAGDLTAIGEKGINLSGGQKQRVSIARAVYAQADVYLFDDPLSALDAHVSKHVFNKCISNNGALQGKLRILVTNQTHCLPHCDSVVFLDAGTIKAQGTFAEVSSNESFKALLSEQQNEDEDVDTTEEDTAEDDQAMIPAVLITEPTKVLANNSDVQKKVPEAKAGENLIQDEERKTGNVNGKTYFDYARACGGVVLFTLLFLFWCTVAALSLIVQWWLSYWAQQEEENPGKHGLAYYLGIYFGLTIAYSLLTFLRSVWYLNSALYASKNLHNSMLASVLRAPLTFFDTTPIGRILSRFSRDVQVMDELLPQFFQQMLTTVLQLVVSYVFIGVVLPLFFTVAVPVTVFYFFLQRFFNRTSLELKRLDSISKSPIYAHFSETLGGLSTLRAYSKEKQSRLENMKVIDINQRAFFTWLVANRWFSMYLELVGSVLIFATGVFGVLARNSVFSGDVGLVLTYALQVTSILGFSVRSITELEGQMNSIERANYYSNHLPEEAAAEVPPGAPKEWPAQGKIEIADVQMRYREGLPLVLRGVSATISGGEKVGVVGRTGSGKSSLMIALLRMVELNDGQVRIDGLDMSQLGLNDIRRRITIIPQDPVIFSGTIRFNLDPFNEHSDVELWDALEKSHLKEFVAGFADGLDAAVSEYGENLSAGQRQVICMTRALLRKSKILILDEASSSLDVETDRLIQETIRRHLGDATILTIAHRLFTLADYDKILVMDDGMAVEFDDPEVLLGKEGGYFSNLVDALGNNGSTQFRRKVSQRPSRRSTAG